MEAVPIIVGIKNKRKEPLASLFNLQKNTERGEINLHERIF